MQTNQFVGLVRNIFVIACATFVLNGCLMDDDVPEADSETGVETGPETESDVQLSGSIGDGPITGALVQILLNDSTVLAELVGDSDANYSVEVRTKGKYYPLIIDARDGLDLVTNMAPDFTLKGALIEPGKKAIANVNPFSTFAYELARDLPGGFNKSNIALAESTVTDSLNFGLTSLAASGPMTTQIDGSNIAEIVRASEALGETVRRTRDTLNMFNYASDGDSVVGALSSDLTDARIDGRGGSRADPRTAAVATIAATLVQLETICNELHVYGVDATSSMNSAILQVSSSTPSMMVDDLRATADMLASIESGLGAAAEVSTDPKIVELQQAVAGLQPGMDYTNVRSRVPDDYRLTLQNVLLSVAGGDDTMVASVNNYTGVGGGSGNLPPTISGNPQTEVNVNTVYDFVPSANDPDLGDTLTFSITGKPSWASFDNTTGQLRGTPGDGEVGTYANVAISVSDGESSDALAPFSISVQGSSLGSVTLNWAAPTQNEDGTPLTDLAGYKFYWGTTPGSYPNSVTLNNAGMTTYVVENLAPGTYEFVATSFNASGVESSYSAPAVKSVF